MNMKASRSHDATGSGHVCPWWLAYSFDNPIRRWIHRPKKLLSPYVTGGMHAVDVGCGMGVFAIAMAALVGDSGRVTALDLQEKMLEITNKRAKRAGLDHRIRTLHGSADQLEGTAIYDFAIAFWMVHEVPDRIGFFRRLSAALKPDGKILVAEPAIHVSRKDFGQTLALAADAGLQPDSRQPKVRLSLSRLLVKGQG